MARLQHAPAAWTVLATPAAFASDGSLAIPATRSNTRVSWTPCSSEGAEGVSRLPHGADLDISPRHLGLDVPLADECPLRPEGLLGCLCTDPKCRNYLLARSEHVEQPSKASAVRPIFAPAQLGNQFVISPELVSTVAVELDFEEMSSHATNIRMPQDMRNASVPLMVLLLHRTARRGSHADRGPRSSSQHTPASSRSHPYVCPMNAHQRGSGLRNSWLPMKDPGAIPGGQAKIELVVWIVWRDSASFSASRRWRGTNCRAGSR